MKIRLPWGRLFGLISQSDSNLQTGPATVQTESDKRRRLYVHCGGDIGSRFNALVTGLFLADKTGLKLELIWPRDDGFSANFSDLFANDLPVIDRTLDSYASEYALYQCFLTEDRFQQHASWLSPLSFPSEDAFLSAIRADERPVLLSTGLIPACFALETVLGVVSRVQFREEIIAAASGFLLEKLGGPFFGMRIIKEDAGAGGVNVDELFRLVKAADKHLFFVSSDSPELAERFAALPNVVLRKKATLREKCQSGAVADHVGPAARGSAQGGDQSHPQSGVDALVDLLVLSHSQVVNTSSHSSLTTALLIQAARKAAAVLPKADSTQAVDAAPVVAPVADEIVSPPLPSLPRKTTLPLFENIAALGLPIPRGILQVGAGHAEEIQGFIDHGICKGLFIEPLPGPYARISELCGKTPGFVAVQTLCAEETGKAYRLHVAGNAGASSSILKPAKVLELPGGLRFDDELPFVSNSLDDVMAFVAECGHSGVVSSLDTLYMDVQGAEQRILLGGVNTLKQIHYIYIGIMRGGLYEGLPAFQAICAWLDVMGFTLNNMCFRAGHEGEALFIRKSLLGLAD